MSSSLFQHVHGVVLVEPSQSAVPGVQVTATLVEKGRYRDKERLLSQTTTDDQGMFSLRFKTTELAVGQVRFAVIDPKTGTLELADHSQVEFPVSDLPTSIGICVEQATVCPFDDGLDEPGPSSGNKIVYGVVRHEDGTPASGLDLEVFRVKVSGESAIGSTTPASPTTDADGEYSITFADDSNPYNLMVVASESGPIEVGRSDVYYAAGDVTRLDIELSAEHYQGKSRYEELYGAIEPERDSVDYDAMTVDQVYKLARVAGVEPLETMDFVAAVKACIKIGLTTFLDGSPDPDRAEQVYGLIRQGWPNHAPGILSGDRTRIEDLLSAAADDRQISRSAADDHASFVSELAAKVVEVALDAGTPGSLGELLGGSRTSLTSSPDQFTEVVAAWRDHSGTVADFWSGLEAATSLSAAQVDEVEFVVRLGVLTDNQPDVVSGIMSGLSSSTDLSGAASWDKSAWLSAIGAVDPEWIEGVDTAARQSAYAEKMMATIEQAYPSTRYRHVLSGSANVSASAKTWLSTNSSIDIGTGHVAYDETDEVNEIRALQRLYRIGPSTGRGEVMTEVYGAGYTSSYKIVSGGKKQFLAAMDGLVDADVAAQVYRNAEKAKAASALLLLQNHPNLNVGFGPAVEGADVQSPPSELGDWATLFGEVSACACSGCRSATSPTAYFVHLMEWLRERGGVVEIPGSAPVLEPPLDSYSVARHALASASGTRRPDLALLKLICANAETPQPYVDLVIEVLEDAVVLSATNGWAIPRLETTWSQDALLVAPEYAHSVAYEMLAGTIYPDPDPGASPPDTTDMPDDFHFPMGLPYDHWADVQRTFLDHVKVSRSRLWELWSGNGVDEDELARERLGITEREWGLLRNSLGDANVLMWTYWQTSGPSSAAVSASAPGDEFTRRLRISFEEAQELLRCRANGAVDASWTRVIEFVPIGDACDLGDWLVRQVGGTDVTAAQMRGIARFARLALKVPWSFRELDSVLASIGVDDVETYGLDATAIREVGAALELQRRYEVPTQEMVLAWADFDLYAGPSDEDPTYTPLYDKLFLNPRLAPDVGDAAYPLGLNDARTALHNSPTVGQVLDLVSGALRTSTEQVLVAAEWAGTSESSTLALADLSQVCRIVFVARWLGWTAGALVAYLNTAGITSIASTPLELLSFLEEVKPLRDAEISGHQWSYLLRNDFDSTDALDLGWTGVAQALTRVREALRAASEGACGRLSHPASLRLLPRTTARAA